MTRKKQHCPKKAHGIVKLGKTSYSKCLSRSPRHTDDPITRNRLLGQESKCGQGKKCPTPIVSTTTPEVSTHSSPGLPSLHYTYKQIWRDNFDEGRRDAKSTGSEESESSIYPLAFYKEAPFLNGLLDQKVSTPSPTLVIHHRYQENSDDDKPYLATAVNNSSPDYVSNYHIGPGSSYAFKVDKTETLWKERLNLNVKEEMGLCNSNCCDAVTTNNLMDVGEDIGSAPISVTNIKTSLTSSIICANDCSLPPTSLFITNKNCQSTSSKGMAAQVKAKKTLVSAMIKHSPPNRPLESKGIKDKSRIKVDEAKSCKVKRRTSARFSNSFSLGYNNMSNTKCILTAAMTQSQPTHKLDGSHWYGPHYPPAVSIHDYHKFYNYLSAKAFKEMILGQGLKDNATSSKHMKSLTHHGLPYSSASITEFENSLNFYKPFTSFFDYSAWPSPSYPFPPKVNDQGIEVCNELGKPFLPIKNHHPNPQFPFMPPFFFPPYPYYYDAPHPQYYNDTKVSGKSVGNQSEKMDSANLSAYKSQWTNQTTSTLLTCVQTEGMTVPIDHLSKTPCCIVDNIPKSNLFEEELISCKSFSAKSNASCEGVISSKTKSPYFPKITDVLPNQYLSSDGNSLNNFPSMSLIPPYDPFNQLPFSIYPRLHDSATPFPFTYPWQYGPPWHGVTTKDVSKLSEIITDKSLSSSASVCMTRAIDVCPTLTQTKRHSSHSNNALNPSVSHTVNNNNNNTAPNPKMVRGQNTWLARGSKKAKDIMKCIWCGESFASLPDLTSHMVATQHYRKIIPIIAAHSHTVGDEGHNVPSPKFQNAMHSSVRSPHQSINKRTLQTLPSALGNIRCGNTISNCSDRADCQSSHFDNTLIISRPNDEPKYPSLLMPSLRLNVMEDRLGQTCEYQNFDNNEAEFRKDEGKRLSNHEKHSEKKEEKGHLNTNISKISNRSASKLTPTVSGLDYQFVDKANALSKPKVTRPLKKKSNQVNNITTANGHFDNSYNIFCKQIISPYYNYNGNEDTSCTTNQNIYKSVLDTFNTSNQPSTPPYMFLFPHLIQSLRTNYPGPKTTKDNINKSLTTMENNINDESKNAKHLEVDDDGHELNLLKPLESLDVKENGVSLLKKQLLSQFIYHDVCPKVISSVYAIPNGSYKTNQVMAPCQESHISALKTLINDTFDTYLMRNFKEIKNLARISSSSLSSNWDADSSESENGRRSSLCIVSC